MRTKAHARRPQFGACCAGITLVEGHADLLPLAPDDVTGNVRAGRLKDKVEVLGDVEGVSNIERRPRNGNVAD
jgi:hypothetical protein